MKGYVQVVPSLERVAYLRAQGASCNAVAVAAGLSHRTVDLLVRGETSVVQAQTEAKILRLTALDVFVTKKRLHGNIQSYRAAKCRCLRCKGAAASYQRRYRETYDADRRMVPARLITLALRSFVASSKKPRSHVAREAGVPQRTVAMLYDGGYEKVRRPTADKLGLYLHRRFLTFVGPSRSFVVPPEDYLHLVRTSVAWAMRRFSPMDRADAESWATEGLLWAAERFNSGRGIIFEKFAAQKMQFMIRDRWRGVYGRKGTPRRAGLTVASLDAPLTSEGDFTLSDTLAVADAADEVAERLDGTAVLDGLLGSLDLRTRTLVYRVVGLGEPLVTVGADYGISESRASQIVSRALARLQGSVL